MKLLLDTHILLWWVDEDARLSRPQRRALSKASAGNPALVSQISFWEIATLVEHGRIHLDRPLREWLEDATAAPLVECLGITSSVAHEVARLPKSLHRDPADRILIATARAQGATLLTQDQRLLDCGLVPTLA